MLCIPRDLLPTFIDGINDKKITDSITQSMLDHFKKEILPCIIEEENFVEYFQDSYLRRLTKSTGKHKGDPEITAAWIVETGFSIMHGRNVRDIHELLTNMGIRNYKGEDKTNWYAGKDICRLLALKRYGSVLNRVSAGNKRILPIETTGGNQNMICTNVAGMQEIILSARDRRIGAPFLKYLELEKKRF